MLAYWSAICLAQVSFKSEQCLLNFIFAFNMIKPTYKQKSNIDFYKQ